MKELLVLFLEPKGQRTSSFNVQAVEKLDPLLGEKRGFSFPSVWAGPTNSEGRETCFT